MNETPYLRELLRFEEQRIGASITWADDRSPTDDESSIVVITSPMSGPTATAVVSLPDGESRRVPLLTVEPATDGRPHSVAGIVVALSSQNLVQLCIDVHAMAEERALLAVLWDGVAEALSSAGEHVASRAEQRQLEEFVRGEESIWRESLRRLPSEIDNLEYAISRMEGQLREQCGRLFELRSQHRAMHLALPEAVRQAAREQLAALRRLSPSLYRTVDVRDGAIVGVLGPVVIEHDDAEVEVGAFEVRLDLASGDISIRNTTHVVNQIHHPHVRGPQDICWGNLRAAIAKLSAEREWAALLVATQRFLASYTEGDSYQPLSAWDPDHTDTSDDDESDYEQDDDDEDSGQETCTLCLEATASDEVTWLRDEPLCLGCYERDVFTCACCRRQFTSREQARESTQCSGCWDAAHFTCPACRSVKPLAERSAAGACSACMASGGWRIAPAPVEQEVAS